MDLLFIFAVYLAGVLCGLIVAPFILLWWFTHSAPRINW